MLSLALLFSCAATRMSPHALLLQHEISRAITADDWSTWEEAFELTDSDADGRISAGDVHSLFVEHHNLVQARLHASHPGSGHRTLADFETEFAHFRRFHLSRGHENDSWTWVELKPVLRMHAEEMASERAALLDLTKHLF